MSGERSFKQELVGVFGYPVAENPTQAMIEPAFADLGLDWRYLTVEVRPDGLRDAVQGARAMGWRGFNCTIPHKIAVIEHLDELSPAAEAIGAVNCAIHRGGRLIGDNTDGKGFVRSVREIRPIEGLVALILGAGGAARAIAVELAMAAARRIVVVSRDRIKGEALANRVEERTGVESSYRPWGPRIAVEDDVNLLVQATPIGLYPDVTATVPIDVASLPSGLIVCDVIPNPPKTRLIRDASARGLVTLDGLGMLVNQGIIGIQLWSGRYARGELMRDALSRIFAG